MTRISVKQSQMHCTWHQLRHQTHHEVEMAELIVEMVPSVESSDVQLRHRGDYDCSPPCTRLYWSRQDHQVCGYHGHVDSLLVKSGSGALTLGNPDSAGIPAASPAKPLFSTTTIRSNQTNLPQLRIEHRSYHRRALPANCGLILPNEGYLQYLRDFSMENKASESLTKS